MAIPLPAGMPLLKPPSQGALHWQLLNDDGKVVLSGQLPDHAGSVDIYIQTKYDTLHYNADSPSRPSKFTADRVPFDHDRAVKSGQDATVLRETVLREYDKQS